MAYARVYQVESVNASLQKSNPPSLLVSAGGQVNSSGWTDGHLTDWVYIVAPSDGIQDYDFVAKKPTGIVLWLVSPIFADIVVPNVDIENYWGEGKALKGIRVHSASCSKEYLFEEGVNEGKFVQLDTDPWPW